MACGISFLSDNNVLDANISITTGTVNAQFPLSNIKIATTTKMFRSNENDVVLVFDLQQTRSLDSVAVAGDATGTLGLTAASIKTSLTTDFSSAIAIPIPLSSEFNMGYEYFTEVDHRYVELTLTGTGSFVELSHIFLGKRIELLQNNLSISSFAYSHSDRSQVSQNRYGQRFIDKLNKQKSVSGAIEHCVAGEIDLLDEMFIRHGISEPLWMIPDKEGASFPDSQYKLTIYGYLESSPEWSASGGQTYSTDIELVQVV